MLIALLMSFYVVKLEYQDGVRHDSQCEEEQGLGLAVFDGEPLRG